ncbi:COP1-interactive protein 1 isoform X3 [Nematostella vectensis]|uniref:COP1-interactive protein 1 isoform X3 n=1 Tax=Nematostella vectensis TaxID=45351 RepID=UPI0020778483|nr:COP1-interactive protein 1 isoform X3 [Nematostella vectensis]
MADRACRNFQPNIFNKNKCQNCFKLQEAHRSSQSSLDLKGSKPKTVVKSGKLSLTYISHDVLSQDKTKAQQTKWQRRWFVLNSAGVLEYFIYDDSHGATDIQVGNINVHDCTNIFNGESDTGETFSIGLKSENVNYYLKAENRLEMDNWSRVLKPYIQSTNDIKASLATRVEKDSKEPIKTEKTPISSFTRKPSLGKTTLSDRKPTDSIDGPTAHGSISSCQRSLGKTTLSGRSTPSDSSDISAFTLTRKSSLSKNTSSTYSSTDSIDEADSTASSFSRKGSVGRTTPATRPATPPRSSSNHPRTKFGPIDNDQHPSVESFKQQIDKLEQENRSLKEQQHQQPPASAKHREAIHILEQDLKAKTNRVKELERDHAKCRDYQKAVIFQEKELQEARSTIRELRQQLADADKRLKQQKGKVSVHAKDLAEAKADLEEANSIISIHKANIEALKEELSSVKQVTAERQGRIILTDEEPESDQFLNALEASGENGQKKDIESKLSYLMEKLRLNERELLVKTRELEKANESRSKVAKYTRSLLQELETKLSNNERKLAETENQLQNKNLELEYEYEQKAKIEKERDKLVIEVERLSDEMKKAGLPKEVLSLMNDAREEKRSENLSKMEKKLSETQEKLQDMEEKFSKEKRAWADEVESLETDVKSLQLISDESESKLREAQSSLREYREENRKLKRELEKFETSKDNKDNEFNAPAKTIKEVKKENSELVKRNTELEEKLGSIDEKLSISLKKEFSVTEENERLLREKKALESRILDAEEQVSSSKGMITALQAKLDDALNSREAKSDWDSNRIYELEEKIKDLSKKLKDVESDLAERDRQIQNLSLEKVNESRDDEITELENELEEQREIIKENEEKLKEKEKEIEKLKKKIIELSDKLKDMETSRNKVETKLAEQEKTIACHKDEIKTARDTINEYKEISARNHHERDKMMTRLKELETQMEILTRQASEYRGKLVDVEEKPSRVREVHSELVENTFAEEAQIEPPSIDKRSRVKELEDENREVKRKAEELEKSLNDKNLKLAASEEKVIELAEELAKRLKLEQETAEWIEGVEGNMERTERDLSSAKSALLEKAKELEDEKGRILDIVELSRKYVSKLETSLAEEKTQKEELEKRLADSGTDATDGPRIQELMARLLCSERERDAERRRAQDLQRDLDATRVKMREELESAQQSHQRDMEKLSNDTLQVSGAAKTQGDELRLRLTSRVITLQSDISELKAAHHAAIEKLKARHKKELEDARREAILETSMRQAIAEEPSEELSATMSDMENDMKDMVERYEAQMEVLKQTHHREIEKLKRTSDSRHGDQAEVEQLQCEMGEMSAKYMEEIEQLKIRHAEELDQLKKDMASVIQASVGNCSTPSKDADGTAQLKARVRELEEELDELNAKYDKELRIQRDAQQKELDQIRVDMMTVIQAIKSQKYDLEPDEEQLEQVRRDYEEQIARLQEEHQAELRLLGGAPTVTVTSEPEDESQQAERIRDLEHEVRRLRSKYESELAQKDNKHEEDMNQLKLDMMVAIQVARSGNASPEEVTEKGGESQENAIQAGMKLSLEAALRRVKELEEENAKIRKQSAEEKDELEKSVKRQEAATMFGLRRNEEMSNKIYRMQKEIEDIDRKYMREINMYKDAFEREKESKNQEGDSPDLSSDYEDLKLEMDELKLRMEDMEVQHENELRVYKDKLGEEKLLDVEDLRLQVKGLEDSIEEMKLEHTRELEEVKEGHAKSIENLKEEHRKELLEAEARNPEPKQARDASSEQQESKVRDLEFKIEELESLLDVKRRRHKEEVKSLKERLDEEIQRHTEDVREYKARLLDGGRRGSASSSAGASEYFRKQISDLRAENRRLKTELEAKDRQTPLVDTTKAVGPLSSTSETRRRQSDSDSVLSRRLDHTKPPLRKTTSNDSKPTEPDSSRRTYRAASMDASTTAGSTGKGLRDRWSADKTKSLTRQSSKTEVKSVAARVAMFQTTPTEN